MTERKIERRLIGLATPIEQPGEYTVPLNLHPDVKANIKVVAQGEE
jgi:ribosomal protein L9